METLSAAAQNELGNNALLVQGAMQSGISHGRHTAARTYWHQWLQFCQQYKLVTYLTPKDPMQLAGSNFLLNEYVTPGFPPPTTLFELEQ
jgi:hypothetical protein